MDSIQFDTIYGLSYWTVCTVITSYLVTFSQLTFCLTSYLLWCLQFKESVAQFAQENIAPYASEIDRTNYFPKVDIIALGLYSTGIYIIPLALC